jgi:outer membrane immunogenic protein
VNSFKTSGLRYSVYVGAMFEVNRMWVFGAEVDYGFYNRTSTVPGILGCSTAACTGGALVPFNLNGDFTSVTNGDDYSFRLRAGYLVTPDLLLYATGGVAIEKISAAMACNGNTSPACNFSLNQTQPINLLSGYTVGAGIEWKLLQRWLIRGEYRYSAYGDWNPVFFKNSGVIEVFPTIRPKSQIATLGLAYLLPLPK